MYYIRQFTVVIFSLFTLMSSLSAYEIVGPAKPTPAEETAIKDLRRYLNKTAKSVTVEGTEVVFHIGNTKFAKDKGIDVNKLPSEKWIIKSFGANVVLAGGGTRGTLYAVYHFLEDLIGVHWWSADAESAPTPCNLNFKRLNISGKPFFEYRDVWRMSPAARIKRDHGAFAIRNRLNRDGSFRITSQYGGSYDWGSPYFVHTASKYIPSARYMKTNPDFFALAGTRRHKHQLCMSNKNLRLLVLEKLKAYIAKDRKYAAKHKISPPVLYDFSMNDNWSKCYCKECKGVMATDNPSGLYLQFINYLADNIKKIYPEIRISMLTYYFLEPVPKITKARDNVDIRLCNTRSRQTVGLNAPGCEFFKNQIIAWSKITRNLFIWDYFLTASNAQGLPVPQEYRIAKTLKFYAEHGVKGVFIESQVPICADMVEYKNWILNKFMENPNADFVKLQKTFLDGYYGAAGKSLLRYRQRLLQAVRNNSYTYILYASGPGAAFDYLDSTAVRDCLKFCDNAVKAVKDNPELLCRVRSARMGLDRYVSAFYAHKYQGNWQGKGDTSKVKLNIDKLRSNVDAHYNKLFKIWYTPRGDDKKKHGIKHRLGYFHMKADKTRFEFQKHLQKIGYKPPKRFKGRKFIDFLPPVFERRGTYTSLVQDPESSLGYAVKFANPKRGRNNAMPMRFAYFPSSNSARKFDAMLTRFDYAGPGYHWYHFGPVKLDDSGYLCFVHSNWIKLSLGPVKLYDSPEVMVYGKIKFDLPKKEVYLERVVITPATSRDRLLAPWTAKNANVSVLDGDETLQIEGATTFFSAKKTAIDLNAKYRLSGEIKLAPGTKQAILYIGLVMFNKKGREIKAATVNALKGSETVLTAPCKKRYSKTARIKQSTMPRPGEYLVFGIDDSGKYSDLPNRTAAIIKKVQRDGNDYIITFRWGTRLWPVGTKVRLHRSGGYMYARLPKISPQWQKFNTTISGQSLYGLCGNKWWHGTRSAKIVVMTKNKAGEKVLIKNVKLVLESKQRK